MKNIDDRLKEKEYLKALNGDLKGTKKYDEEEIILLEKDIEIVEKHIDNNNYKIDIIDSFLNKLQDLALESGCLDILDLKLKGYSNLKISKELKVHRNTVKNRWEKFERFIEEKSKEE